jgi:hypothetical protein
LTAEARASRHDRKSAGSIREIMAKSDLMGRNFAYGFCKRER